MNLSRTFLWRKLREREILAAHKRVARICQTLIDEYMAQPVDFPLSQKMNLATDKIIWQYWAQGYDNVPDIIKGCLDSVDKFAGDYHIIRLSEENLDDYLELPVFVKEKKSLYSRAFFSDLLRLMLLKTYGGIWMDATIMLSGPIPEDYVSHDFFVFRRDPNEPDFKYWRETYAYYFGWAKGFKVNMLSSFMVAKKGARTITDLCNLMLLWWKDHDTLPDYFFLMILFDVYNCSDSFPLVSDTLPHYLQQYMNDSRFNLASKEKILQMVPIHKLTYK